MQFIHAELMQAIMNRWENYYCLVPEKCVYFIFISNQIILNYTISVPTNWAL